MINLFGFEILMEAPQMIVVALTIWSLTHEGMKHGDPKDGYHSFWTSGISQIVSFGLMYWGGFFG